MSNKRFNIFKKEKKNKKIDNEIIQDSDKLASYYNTDKQKYVIAKIPKYMNIINNKNYIKKPNIAGVFLDNTEANTEKKLSYNGSTYKNHDGMQVSINLLANIIKEKTDKEDNDTDTSYDSFFDVDLYSDFSDEEDNTNSLNNSQDTDSMTSINDLDPSFREDQNLVFDQQKEVMFNQRINTDDKNSIPLLDIVDSDLESERSNIFSSRYRNKQKNKDKYLEPSELMYIPSEN
jgi:hypothetical protein